MRNNRIMAVAIAAGLALLAAWWLFPSAGHQDEHAHADDESPRGPHQGRWLEDGDFALELLIFEQGTPPHFRAYAYEDGEPLAPSEVTLTVELTRLDGEVDRFTFTPQADRLTGAGIVEEPHSFDVSISAEYDGETHRWTYASYEGRTRIGADAAAASGIETAKPGPARIRDILPLTGRVMLNPNHTAEIRARFPGIVREVRKQLGDRVEAGEVLAMIESNDSLLPYAVKSPIGGVVLSRSTQLGDVTGERALFTVSDLSDLWAEFHVFPRDMERVRPGQPVTVTALQGEAVAEATVDSLLPVAERDSQTVVARVTLPNPDGQWRAGMSVRGAVVLSEREVPLAVRTAALQRFRDQPALFVRVGDVYEVRLPELGAGDGDFTEVLGGLKPDADYVSANSYLIRADIEKSGAGHDH